MLAFIHALLRFFGLGSPAKKQPAPSAAAGSRSPVWDNWLRQAQALHDTPPDTGPLPADQAVLILESAALLDVAEPPLQPFGDPRQRHEGERGDQTLDGILIQ
jgi:hypothetical protein